MGNEILAALIGAAAALIGLVVGAILNSYLQRQDKAMEHLFTYKVKTYMELAKIVTETMRGLEKIRSEYYSKKECDNFYQLYIEFKNTIAEQALFTSQNTKVDIDALYTSFHKIYDNELLFGESFEVLIPLYTESISECKQFIIKMQHEIGFTKHN